MPKRQRLGDTSDSNDSGSDTERTARGSVERSHSNISKRGWRPEETPSTGETREEQTIIADYKAVVSEYKKEAQRGFDDLQKLIKLAKDADAEFIAILQDDDRYVQELKASKDTDPAYVRRALVDHSDAVALRQREFESFERSRAEVINSGKEAAEKAHKEMRKLYEKIPESRDKLEEYRNSLNEQAGIQNSYFNARKTIYQDYLEELKKLNDEHVPVNPMKALHGTIEKIMGNKDINPNERRKAIYDVLKDHVGEKEAARITVKDAMENE